VAGITGAQIVAAREKYKGVPYSQRNPQSMAGMDCSGVIQAIMRDLGVTIPRTTSMQLAAADSGKVGKNIGTNLGLAQPGDILHYTGHEEMWLGGGQVFSEATYGTKAGDRGRTPMIIAGIVRYADGGAGSSSPSPAAGSGGSPLAALASGSFWIRVLMFIAGVLALSVVVWELVKNG
jgi:cell wall-associated NlpC family hydrolase